MAFTQTQYKKPQQAQTKAYAKPEKKEYFAPQTLASANITGFVRTDIQEKTFKDVTIAEFLISFGQKPDKDGNKSGSISVKAFGDVAQFLIGNVTKGSKVQVMGRLTEEVWADKESGARRNKHVVVADVALLLVAERENEEIEE